MTDLDRLLELYLLSNSSTGLFNRDSKEFDSLKKEISDNLQNFEQLISLGVLERDSVYVGLSKKIQELIEKGKKFDKGACNSIFDLLDQNKALTEQVKDCDNYIKELEHKLGIDLQRKGTHYHKDITCPNLEIIKQLQEELSQFKSKGTKDPLGDILHDW